nr:T9SS type A sorting domain-containing protein [Kaistella soli]
MYEPETTLVTGGRPKDHLTVYQNGNEVVLNSGDQKINGVEVFDAAGRSVDRIKTNAAKVSVNSSRWNDGVYLLYITRGSSVTVRKVMK